MKTKPNTRYCNSGLKFKEESEIYQGLVATSHPDRVNDILSFKALNQIADYINNENSIGDQQGAYRSVSVGHDWIKQNDPELDEAASVSNARVIKLEDNHFGVEIDMKLNEFYRGEMTAKEIKSRVDSGHFSGLSIEFDTNPENTKPVIKDGIEYNFIEELSTYGGQALARGRLIANTNAIIYKEIEKQMVEEENQTKEAEEAKLAEEAKKVEDAKLAEEAKKVEDANLAEEAKKVEELEQKEVKLKKDETPTLGVKELLQSKEFKAAVEKELKVEKKVLKEKETKVENITLSIKEMNDAATGDTNARMSYQGAKSLYFKEHDAQISDAFRAGVPLNTTLQVKCVGNKLMIASDLTLQTKDTLDTGTNPSTYTQNATELADVYMPGLIDTFNNQTNLFGALRKVDNIEGSDKFGWKITTSKATTLSVDVDDTSVNKVSVNKLKLQTQFKEYRIGVSVTDYMLNFARASMGDLFGIEVEKNMRDLMKDINKDLFTEQVDSGTKILGLEAVADSAGNTTLYGLTRTAANRLAPDSASDTYEAVGGAVTDILLTGAATKVETEGAAIANIRYVVAPSMRDKIYQLNTSKQRFSGTDPNFGFKALHKFSYNGYPMIVDFDCQSDAVFVFDDESYYIAMDRVPQLIGLAKVGAADEGYISTYIAAVYEQPRRIHMLDTLS